MKGEEAVVAKEAVVTGEVVIKKDAVSTERQITDTVRKQHVDVDRAASSAPNMAVDTRETVAATPPRTMAAPLADPEMAAPVTAPPAMETAAPMADTPAPSQISAAQLQEGMLVPGSDDERIGWVKEVRARDVLVDRRLRRDIYVPFTAIQAVVEERIVLRIASTAVNAQGWPNP